VTVALAYVHDREVTHSFHDSLNRLILHDLTGPTHLFGGENPIKMRCGTGGIVGARNKVALRVFGDADYDWLFWIDTDMGFEPDTIDRLLAVADPVERPIVGGLCFVQYESANDGIGGFRTRPLTTIFDWHDGDPRGFRNRVWYQPDAVTRCDGTGSACILIHRSVLERIHGEYGPCWYDQAPGDQGLIGEDLSFCMRAATVGCPVHVHAGVRTSHMKTVWLAEDDFWAAQPAPPATDPCAVLVPVMRRPQNALPFMRSLRASTGLARAYAIYDEDDVETRDAWVAAGARVLCSTGSTFATKVNDGYRATDEPWLFLCGDDVRFWPGWLDHAQLAAAVTDAQVVGTNDLGNARVMRGEHATHLLVRRSYVDEQGASWDGPGVVCHEGYRHWYVDDEIVTAAKQRGVWSMSLASKVEHLHPLWGKAEPDAVYELGQACVEADGRLFRKRLHDKARFAGV
jgi:hypothetical protein